MTDRFESPDGADELVGDRLQAGRPVPRAGFRAELHAHLLDLGLPVNRPARLWAWVAAGAASGTGLLVLAALGVAGAGPLAG